jgi:hypothetical protein
MPILMLALMALGVFLIIGLLLFSATMAERRQRDRTAAAAAIPAMEPPAATEKPKARAAHA